MTALFLTSLLTNPLTDFSKMRCCFDSFSALSIKQIYLFIDAIFERNNDLIGIIIRLNWIY